MKNTVNWDCVVAAKRCMGFRKRVLDLSQRIPTMHIAPAFSCLEIIDSIYYGLMRRLDSSIDFKDFFVLSKGHGCIALYVVLESLGILSNDDMENYCKPGGRLGGHPDYGVPGINASTGALGHGLSIALGMAYAEKLASRDSEVFVVLGDGEMQEGSIWEGMMIAPNLGLNNVVAFLDLNNYQSLGKISDVNSNFFPIVDKCAAFGWEVVEVNGHASKEIISAVKSRSGKRPAIFVCNTVKGKGVDFMIDSPIWHYRTPNNNEYIYAIDNLKEVLA
jgi:transketolase